MIYKGIELEEITAPQIFDPPQEMLVIDEYDDMPIKKFIAAILATDYCHKIVATDETFWQSCFRIPNNPKPRRATNSELSKWLALGNGLMNSGTIVSGNYTYALGDDEKDASLMVKVRKWNDTEWHEPTVDYMDIEQ